ncbi:MAG: 3-phosphoshikimate 1-carboxyvinyltransferase [Clostridia bacterium]|nr:3-phosphoshikimate 1-carboxyvinyltransferase [Clostridia bacterium]
MKVLITPSQTGGRISAIASKSAAHRALICAAFADKDTRILCHELNEDIEATVRCLSALGANIERDAPYYLVKPVKNIVKGATLDCGESGSTMRFLVPVACLLGADASFLMSGRLPNRPLSPLREELERCGITFSEAGSNPLVCRGKVTENEFAIRGDVSSQFISGLLFALAVSGRAGKLRIIGKLESAPYVDITADMLRRFGVDVSTTEDGYEIKKNGGLVSPFDLAVEGDWSNAAFPLALGAIGKRPVSVSGLDENSRQGDKGILDVLRSMGARVESDGGCVTVYPSALGGARVDSSQIPDLVPIIATVASVAEGETVIYNAGRLRIKESDRLLAVSTVLRGIGANVTETEDGLRIVGVPALSGGEVSSFGDHRIVMSAAVASVRCRNTLTIDGAEAVAKSYPKFFEDMRKLGLK